MDDLKPAVWEAPDDLGYAGYPLTLAGDRLLVSALGVPGSYSIPRVWALDPVTLEVSGSWVFVDRNVWDAGTGVASAEVGGTRKVLVGFTAFHLPDLGSNGGAFLFDGPPRGEVEVERAEPVWYQSTSAYAYAGTSTLFAAVGEGASPRGVVGGGGKVYPGSDGLVAILDPTIDGPLVDVDATTLLRGPPGTGERVSAADVDADGHPDLVVTTDAGVGYVLGPVLPGEHALSDVLDGEWTSTGDSTLFGQWLEGLADVTGDGLPDLGFADIEQEVRGAPRAGAAWVVAGGDPRPGPVDGLPIRVEGTEVGEGVAYGMTSGDLDGDGEADLVLGAPGVYPGVHPGKVVVFRGPVAEGTYTTGDADAVLYGESDWDLFGFSVLAADTTGDDRAELYVGAPGSPRESGRGSVYLLPGGSVLP
ncbi:MAG: FG-GAP repeat protein [Alphaproteobacteria bacterium]|nr:FG-GAP repeat protein [Alphaproteobacteria bacterium]MCB9699903.1 FG-GAP repeat protein [Alphaproteobacteria bacterium]